jgi:hypothetical protein
MDPATSVLSIIHEALKIAKYIGDVHEGHKERKQLSQEMVAVYQLFLGIQDQFAVEGWESDETWSRAIRPLFRSGGVIEQLRDTLSSVVGRLTLPEPGTLKRIGRALKWPFDKDEIQELTDRIHTSLQMVMTALTQTNLEIGRETHTNARDAKDILQAQELQRILDWISPLDFRATQESAQKQPVKGTCHWFLEHPSFTGLENGLIPLLWCHGIPGAGKTLLASSAFEHLNSTLDFRNVVMVAFCAFNDEQTHSALGILSALLRQLVFVRQGLSDETQTLCKEHISGQKKLRPSLEQLCEALNAEMSRLDSSFIILDGLDEMPEHKERALLLQKQELLRPRPMLMVTSRPLPMIRSWFVEEASTSDFHLEDEDIDNQDENAKHDRTCDEYDDR